MTSGLLKISSLTGANRKRKWRPEEEEEEEVEEKDGENSETTDSSDDNDEEKDEAKNRAQENNEIHKPEIPAGSSAESTAKAIQGQAASNNVPPKLMPKKEPSEPAVFVPVDRLPEVQVSLSGPHGTSKTDCAQEI